LKKIIFNTPSFSNSGIQNIKLLKAKNFFSSGGFFTKKCENWLEKNIKVKKAILTNSCTAALEMCSLLLDINKGDEVIMPSYTFVSTANAFVLRGAIPVFAEIDERTKNIDASKIESLVTKRTRALVVVHYAGVSCDMDKIMQIVKKKNIYLIEDAAHSILSYFRNRPLGSYGDLATFSFHETKNIHCGEGGALLINNIAFVNRAKILRDKGTNRDDFNNNLTKKYTWVDLGSSYGLSEINAAFLFKQLLEAWQITKKRLVIWKKYYDELYTLEAKSLIKRPVLQNYSKHNGHIFYIVLGSKTDRHKLIKFLKIKKIMSIFHYIPLHNSPYGKRFYKNRNLKVTERISDRILRLPIHNKMTIKKAIYVCKIIKIFFDKKI